MSLNLPALVAALGTFTLSNHAFVYLCVLLFVLVLVLFFILQPKYYYIVRHGETELNSTHIKQGSEGGLNEKGTAQAQALGAAFSHFSIQHIYTSPYERAVQTAEILRASLRCGITRVPSLAERRNASETIGKKTDDPEVMRIEALTKYGFHDDTFRFSDEENFDDLKQRARACLTYLAHRPHTRMVVVTHHVFLHIFLAYLLYGEKLHANDLVKLSFYNPVDNGSITMCVYHPWHGRFQKTRGWEIRTYNQSIS